MAATRRINLNFITQFPRPFKLKFIGNLLGDSGEVFLSTVYQFDINTDGTVGATANKYIDLPVPFAGSRFYKVDFPRDYFTGKSFQSVGFYLSAGAAISLGDSLAGGNPPADEATTLNLIESRISGAAGALRRITDARRGRTNNRQQNLGLRTLDSVETVEWALATRRDDTDKWQSRKHSIAD